MPRAVRAAFREMEAEGRRRLGAASFSGPVRVRPSADMRYGEQVFEVGVPLDHVDFERPDLLQQMADAFHSRHEELYTYSLRDQEAVLVNARVAVIGELPASATGTRPAGPAARPAHRSSAGSTLEDGAMCRSMHSMRSPRTR